MAFIDLLLYTDDPTSFFVVWSAGTDDSEVDEAEIACPCGQHFLIDTRSCKNCVIVDDEAIPQCPECGRGKPKPAEKNDGR